MPMVNHFFLSSLPYTMGIVIIWFLIAYWANTSIINSATGSKPLDRIENKTRLQPGRKPMYVARHEDAENQYHL